MKRLSRLSKECIANEGLCCEHRTPPFLSQSEIKLLLAKKEIKDQFVFGKCNARPKSICPFFKKPFCTIYQKRPVDCRTYPVSVDLDRGKAAYFIDMKCPAVKKGLVSNRFIQQAIKIWQEKTPTKEWIKEYLEKKEVKNYIWVTIEKYQAYRKKLNSQKNKQKQ